MDCGKEREGNGFECTIVIVSGDVYVNTMWENFGCATHHSVNGLMSSRSIIVGIWIFYKGKFFKAKARTYGTINSSSETSLLLVSLSYLL